MSQLLSAPPDASAPVLVGFSGGLDSSVLLHWLASSRAQREAGLGAIHIDHGLQPQSATWGQHCQQVCAGLGLALQRRRVNVPRDSGHGLEAAARDARHAAFASALAPGQRLALAQHRDDQAETFLLRALRASGPDGLAAMAHERRFAAGTLWRPLLTVPRQTLLDYARQHRLSWLDDPSNASLEHDRNFLRHRILPLLRERWPQADAALARSAELSGQAADLLAAGDSALDALLDRHGALDLDRLRDHPAALRARLLRHWVARQQGPALPACGVAALETELTHGGSERTMRFAWRDVEIRRWRRQFHLLKRPQPWPPDWRVSWDGRASLTLPDGGTLTLLQHSGAALSFDRPLRVCGRVGGERIVLPGRGHSHALKHLLQDTDIPPWRRQAMPLLFDGEELLAAGDGLIAGVLHDWLRTRAARLHWQAPPR